MSTTCAKYLTCAFLAVFAQAGTPAVAAPAGVLDKAFPAGGRVHMKLSAGGYKLRGASTDGQIHVRWHTKEPDAVRVSLEVKAGEAWLQTKGPRDNFEVEIDLPRRTDLKVRLSVGELDIQGLEGHKDLACRVGEISVADHKAGLRSAEAAVKIGGLQVFGVERGGFFRSEHWQGTGAYDVLAKVGTGEVRLFEADLNSAK